MSQHNMQARQFLVSVRDFLRKKVQALEDEVDKLEQAAKQAAGIATLKTKNDRLAIQYSDLQIKRDLLKLQAATREARRKSEFAESSDVADELNAQAIEKLKQQITEAKRLAKFADDPERQKLAKELVGLQAKAKLAAKEEEIANFGIGTEERNAQRRLDFLKRAEKAQFRLNNLHLEYLDVAQKGLVDLITSAGTLSDKAQAFLQQLYNVTVERIVDASLTSLGTLGSAKVVAGAGKVVAPGGPGGGGVNMYVDARGGDEQSVQRALNRALPEIVAAGEQLRLGMYNDDPVARRRARRGQRR